LPEIERRRAEDELQARAELSEFLRKVSGDVRWNIHLRTGDPRQVILDLAREGESDLVAVGTKGRTGLAHMLVGSVADGVLRSAPCDVLVARLLRANVRLP
jgi:nucleotide-binding universal stress UspA family protein